MKKRYPYLIGACLAATVLILPGCTPKQSTFAEEKAVQMEKPAKGYNPYMEVSYARFGSLPYLVGSADAITIASIVKDHGIITLKEGDGYADYRIYTLKAEHPFKPGLGNGEEFQVKVDNFAERKELTEKGLYFLSNRYDKYQYSFPAPDQTILPIENGEIQLTEDTKVFFPDYGEKIPVGKAIEEIQKIIQ